MLDKDGEREGEYPGPIDLPDEHDPSPDEDYAAEQSLTDDIIDLIDDGRAYVEAELAYQKSRGTYVAHQATGMVAYGLGAFGVLHLALIAATVGAVIALVPHIGAWGATVVVTGVLVVLGAIFIKQVRKRIRKIAVALGEKDE